MPTNADKKFRKGGVSNRKANSDIEKIKTPVFKPRKIKLPDAKVRDASKKFRSRKP